MTRRGRTIAAWLGYGFLVLVGLGIAATPFVMGGFTLAGAADIIAKFVALPAAKLLFGALYEAVGPWVGLAIVSSLPLAITAVVHAVTSIISSIVNRFSAGSNDYSPEQLKPSDELNGDVTEVVKPTNSLAHSLDDASSLRKRAVTKADNGEDASALDSGPSALSVR